MTVKPQTGVKKKRRFSSYEIPLHLMLIPGIGRSKAEKIIEYREENGRFGSPEEITNVNGIGDSMYEKMKDCITAE